MEHNSSKTFRKHLKAEGAHIQRVEDKLTPGVPDINFCWNGMEGWMEGKYVKLPSRDSTLITFGQKQRVALQANWIKARRKVNGFAGWWVRVEGSGWYLMIDKENWLKNGIVKSNLLELYCYKTARDLVVDMLEKLILHNRLDIG